MGLLQQMQLLIIILFKSVYKWLKDLNVHLTILVFSKILLLTYFHHINSTSDRQSSLVSLDSIWRIYSEHVHGQRESGADGKVKEALTNRSERMEQNKRSAGSKGELT